jgi:hypothetical protein
LYFFTYKGVFLFILIILVCGRSLVGGWSVAGRSLGRFDGRFIFFIIIILTIYNTEYTKLAGRFDGQSVGRF